MRFSKSFGLWLAGSILVLDQYLKYSSVIVWYHYRPPFYLVVIAVLLVLLWSQRSKLRHSILLPVLLLCAGVVSNALDLLLQQQIINYYPLYNWSGEIWATTNIADLVIWLAIIWLLIDLLRATWRQRQ